MEQASASNAHDIVDQYFALIKELRSGDEDAVDKLVKLWSEDGVFEFAGAAPVTGTYKGRNAIHVLYANRVKACGMPLKLRPPTGAGDAVAAAAIASGVALGIVDTEVKQVRAVRVPAGGDQTQRLVAGWSTTIGTSDQRGFKVGGSHTFTFKRGKISALKVVVAPKPEAADGLVLADLAVKDIGMLSLAAWCVV